NSSVEDFDNFIVKVLLADLLKYNAEKKIDLIILSGDLVNKGGEGFSSTYEALQKFNEKLIFPISEKLNLSNDSIFISPGNHDITRYADKQYTEDGLFHYLTSIEKLNKFIDDCDTNSLKRIEGFKKYETEFYENFSGNKNLSLFESSFFIKKNNYKVGITAFNSAWRCYSDDDKNKLLLGERQITNSRKIIDAANLKIAIMHHPFEWIAEFDKKNIVPFFNRDYDMIFFGHNHEASVQSIATLQGKVIHLHAPSNWAYNLRSTDFNSSNGYTVVDFIPEEGNVVIHHRLYSHAKEAYVPNVIIGNDTGIVIYPIPTHDDLDRSISEFRIVKNIESLRFSELNEHLISFSTSTHAPKEINKIFVEPRLFYTEKDEDGDEKEVIFDFDKLIQSNENFIIFGTKESGKTILLDHLLIECSKKLNLLHKIPVYFDFNEIGNKRFETIISQFLSEPITLIPEFLQKNQIIFLVDNLNFVSINQTNLNRLTNFIKQNKIQVIATSFEYIEGEPPFDFINSRPNIPFILLHIKSFNAHQIRSLIDNWFCKNPSFDTPEKCDRILNILLALNLPRSPLTISMFLWIIEQQEGYRPQNKSMMLEIFLEKVLEKSSKKSILSERFDYTNKVNLLSEIAYKMYSIGDINYSLSQNVLSNFVHERILAKKFDFDSADIIQELLEKGILVKEHNGSENMIRFRFSCFFEYFLMKKMESDSEFLNKILTDYNYLQFSNEIDYYTGIKRNQKQILELIVNDMEKLYSDLLKTIGNNPESFDAIFSTSNDSIASQLDSNFINDINSSKEKSQEELLDIQDQILDTIPQEKELTIKNKNMTATQKLEKIWTLAARVLKNSEEVDIEDLKTNSFVSIVKCSLAFALLYRQHLVDTLANTIDEKQISNYELFLKDFLPLIHQLVLNRLLGTAKLNVVIKERLDSILDDENITDFEKYVVVFLYSDLRGRDYTDYLRKFVKNIKRANLFDVTLFKLLTLYYFRSKSEESDNIFENLIGDVIVGAKGLPKVQKGKIIESYRKKKKQELEKKDDDLFII
ncbi:MAG: metallophosphoesterase, partial [Ignavibacterium sp.]|nr:metallophosphoesterase [Ignavibacterium sp.]